MSLLRTFPLTRLLLARCPLVCSLQIPLQTATTTTTTAAARSLSVQLNPARSKSSTSTSTSGSGKKNDRNSSNQEPRRNQSVRPHEFLLLDVNGAKLGVVSRDAALRLARERGALDVVEVNISAKPAVCKLIKSNAALAEEAAEEDKEEDIDEEDMDADIEDDEEDDLSRRLFVRANLSIKAARVYLRESPSFSSSTLPVATTAESSSTSTSSSSSSQKPMGPFPISKARTIASEHKLNLVEVDSKSSPPICELMTPMELMQFRKSIKQANREMKGLPMKEIRLGSSIFEPDLLRQIEKIREFLESGMRVKLRVLRRGTQREVEGASEDVFERVLKALDGVAVTSVKPTKLGSVGVMILEPRNKNPTPSTKPSAPSAPTATPSKK